MPIRLTFSEGSGLNDSVYGKCQAPIRMFLEKRGEAFEQESVVERLFLMGTSENYGDLLTSMTAIVVSTLIESTSCASPNSSMMMGSTTFFASSGNKRHKSSVQPACTSIERYWSRRVTSCTTSLVRCSATSLHSHLAQYSIVVALP